MGKLIVFCLDALCSLDIEFMKTLPNFAWLISNGSYVLHAEPIYPSTTYPCHTSIITGNYVNRHGVYHNAPVEVGNLSLPWFNQRSDIKCATLLDSAKLYGYRTCSISWPVTGGADFDLNMPMIVPIDYSGPDPLQFLINNATGDLIERYYSKYAHYLIGKNRSLDHYTMAIALDIIRDYQQPDVMLIKMCDLDSVRHVYGVDNSHVHEQLRIHDDQFGLILDMVKKHGDIDNTNFIILGDHGQSDIVNTLNMNIILKNNGYLKVDDDNKVIDYDAYCHSVSLSAWIQLKHPEDFKQKKNIYEFLLNLKMNKRYGIGYVYTKQEAEQLFHLSGPFDFIIEGEKPTTFESTLIGNDIFGTSFYPGHKKLVASHGGLPFKDETTTFIAFGPTIKKGVAIQRRSIVDVAPTMATMLGFKLSDVDGKPIFEILK